MKLVLASALLVVATAAVAAPIRLEEHIDVSSASFAANGDIPSEYTCDGADVSPPLAWSTVPADTKSVAVQVQDIETQRVLLLVTGISPAITSLARATSGWTGPCPRHGAHRYMFTVYALDIELPARMSSAAFTHAIANHVLASGQLAGNYHRTE